MDKQTEIQAGIINKALEFYKEGRFGYIDGAMRLGKIKISIEIMSKLLPPLAKVLLAYPDNKIKDSWIAECEKWGYDDINITYTNFSSLHKYKESSFDFFIIDEFHSASPLERDYCQQI